MRPLPSFLLLCASYGVTAIVHHWSRLSLSLSDSGEDGEALSSVHSTALAVGIAESSKILLVQIKAI
ncbi:hypothetical protein EMIHUDRAFT_208013 [Emiliania huxleyi CCMP1516]|uniref:Secreted protein n=2 Tax=Emiliania huxleyi TaxID=2903 RepID=A0A0D3JBS6_EMIH1|nr:hypothetical protein EMIHUDRAFT_208013 [Emiliania huxleyi CCMP1516]EOD20961.1 hypothetical protein EMIHUDRAFT_208013 [Emiliania huxleyi CCMP1516]|eukprot:XP_005773390.1 hypothetical protein EMIHUDRAFT_208013 [Emiliania huxleyi CCMP1516]